MSIYEYCDSSLSIFHASSFLFDFIYLWFKVMRVWEGERSNCLKMSSFLYFGLAISICFTTSHTLCSVLPKHPWLNSDRNKSISSLLSKHHVTDFTTRSVTQDPSQDYQKSLDVGSNCNIFLYFRVLSLFARFEHQILNRVSSIQQYSFPYTSSFLFFMWWNSKITYFLWVLKVCLWLVDETSL